MQTFILNRIGMILNHTGTAFKQMGTPEKAAIIATIAIVAACLLFLAMAVVRRLYNGHRYRVLDDLRAGQLIAIRNYIKTKHPDMESFRARPGSRKWVALEDTLFSLAEDETNRIIVRQFFEQLGYVEHYLKDLNSRRVITRASAIAKLGRMGNSRTAEALLAMLETSDPEIVAVTVRAIAKTGNASTLIKLMNKIPVLLEKNLIAKKTIDSSLIAASSRITPVLLDFGKTCSNATLIASILSVLSSFPVDRDVYDFAVSHFCHPDAEVRAKAARLVMFCEEKVGILHESALLPLLKDPVWFVRLHALRSLGNRKQEKYIPEIFSLVFDEKWQVRNEAAINLTLLGKEAIDAFLWLLKSDDEYIVASICEEIEKTNFVDVLLGIMTSPQQSDTSQKAKEILTIMVSRGFSSPLGEFAKTLGAGTYPKRQEAS